MKTAAFLLLASFAGAAQATECREDTYQGDSYTICEVDLVTEELRLFLRDDQGDILGSFWAVDAALAEQG